MLVRFRRRKNSNGSSGKEKLKAKLEMSVVLLDHIRAIITDQYILHIFILRVLWLLSRILGGYYYNVAINKGGRQPVMRIYVFYQNCSYANISQGLN
jgi:hypothetical protein